MLNIFRLFIREGRIVEDLIDYFQNKTGLQGSINLSEILILETKTYREIKKGIVICNLDIGRNQEANNLFKQIDKDFPITIVVGEKVKGIEGHGFFGKSPNKVPVYIGGKMTNIESYKGRNKKVCAIVSAYQDEDIIEDVCLYLLNQELYVHVIDNWSKDSTHDILVELNKKNDKLTYERFPSSPDKEYLWFKILKRKEEFAKEGKYDWYIHYDSDEIRESCWNNYSIARSISFIDSLGFNMVDHTVLDFRPVNDKFRKGRSLKESFNYFEFGTRPGHFLQRKAWKSIDNIDLVSSGGHVADFPNQKVFPFKFLLRHYPLRNLTQMHKKIFKDRLPRVQKEKIEFGWHVQYDNFKSKENQLHLWKPWNLNKYDANFYSNYLLERLTGIGISIK